MPGILKNVFKHGKRKLSPNEETQGWLKASLCRLEGTQFFISQGNGGAPSRAAEPSSSLLEQRLISGGFLRGIMASRRIVLLTSCCPGCTGEDPGHEKA